MLHGVVPRAGCHRAAILTRCDPPAEWLLAGGVLVLQLHDRETEHHHGRIGDDGELGNGVLLWFGEVSDFDEVVVASPDGEAFEPA
jgi:hypothetical protein